MKLYMNGQISLNTNLGCVYVGTTQYLHACMGYFEFRSCFIRVD